MVSSRCSFVVLAALAATTVQAVGPAGSPMGAGPGGRLAKKKPMYKMTTAHSQNLLEGEKESVDMATIHWMNCVTTEGDTSEAVANLYAEDAVLWGTVANDVRFEPLDVETYFQYFANIPGLRVKPGSFKSVVQVCGRKRDLAISSGYYEFMKPDGTGGVTSIPARFTFTYRKSNKPGLPNSWAIINHHSSAVRGGSIDPSTCVATPSAYHTLFLFSTLPCVVGAGSTGHSEAGVQRVQGAVCRRLALKSEDGSRPVAACLILMSKRRKTAR